MKNADSENLYKLEGTVPLLKAVPVGLQHVLAMFIASVAAVVIFAGSCNVERTVLSRLIQNSFIITGLGTLLQLRPVGRLGSALPIVMGMSFTFLGTAIYIGNAYSVGTVMGCVLIGGIIEGILGLFAKYWSKLISPIVAAVVVTAIGFSLLPIGSTTFAGGTNAADFASAPNLIVGTISLLSCFVFGLFAKGYFKALSVLFGLAAGYVAALFFGIVDFSILENVSIIVPPLIMPFKIEFNLAAILSFSVIYLVSATETIGDTSAVSEIGLNRHVTPKEISGSLAVDGFISAFGSLFGCTPITSFSENIGIVAMTKVVNRFTIGTGAVIMILIGIFPVFGRIFATIPQPVIGGCSLMIFGTILIVGIKMLSDCGFTRRNETIAAFSLGTGLSISLCAEFFHIFPQVVQSVFAGNCVSISFVLAVILNLALPKDF